MASARLTGAFLGVSVLAAATAGGGMPVASGETTVTLTSSACTLGGARIVPAGPVAIAMRNRSGGQFDLDLWKLKAGRRYSELAGHISAEDRRLRAGKPPLGHPASATLVAQATTKRRSGALVRRLTRGTYGFACVRLAGGVPVRLFSAGPLRVGR